MNVSKQSDSTSFLFVLQPEVAIALGDCLKAIINPSADVEDAIRARIGLGFMIGVHVRVTMSR